MEKIKKTILITSFIAFALVFSQIALASNEKLPLLSPGYSSSKSQSSFTLKLNREHSTFYVNTKTGDDKNDGQSPKTPWKSLKNVRNNVFIPGDTIKLHNESVFNGKDAELTFKGSGSKDNNIVIEGYGDNKNSKPKLNGLGKIENVIKLYDQQFITIRGLEITNLDNTYNTSFDLNKSNNDKKILRGIYVIGRDAGVLQDITLSDLYIHDINGNIKNKLNGGIIFTITARIENKKPQGKPTKFHNVLVENCKMERIDRSGIKMISSIWTHQSPILNNRVDPTWYPSTNVVIRGNSISQAGGDGITVMGTDGALVEHNVAKDSRYQNTGYNVGIWPFSSLNTVIQYNESFRTRGVTDGQGFDLDHASANNVMQYNYSHNNEGGFMLIMNWAEHTAPTIRYNISQNDRDKTFEFARGIPAGTSIYNNTIYSDFKINEVFKTLNFQNGTGSSNFYVFNNIFFFPARQNFYGAGKSEIKSHIQLFNNGYFGGIKYPSEEQSPITGTPKFVDFKKAPEDNTSMSVENGDYIRHHLKSYAPRPDSKLNLKGMSIEDITKKYNGNITDRRKISPYQQFLSTRNLSNNKSIDFTMGNFFPEINGVTYNTDILGNTLKPSEKPSIGAVYGYKLFNNIMYSIKNDGIHIEGTLNNSDTITIPSSIDGTPVVFIEDNSLKNVKEVFIEGNNIKTIENSAFSNNVKITFNDMYFNDVKNIDGIDIFIKNTVSRPSITYKDNVTGQVGSKTINVTYGKNLEPLQYINVYGLDPSISVKHNVNMKEVGKYNIDYYIYGNNIISTTVTISVIVNYPVTSSGLVYKPYDNYVDIVDYKGNNKDVTIPTYIDDKPIVSIYDNAFNSSYVPITASINKPLLMYVNSKNNTKINKLTFQQPSFIQNIGNYAFFNNDILELNLPYSIKNIGDFAFSKNNITNLQINSDHLDYFGKSIVDNNVNINFNNMDTNKVNDLENIVDYKNNIRALPSIVFLDVSYENEKPSINVNVGEKFNPLDYIKVVPYNSNIEIIENTVNINKKGHYNVVYNITGDNVIGVQKTLSVNVVKSNNDVIPTPPPSSDNDDNITTVPPKDTNDNINNKPNDTKVENNNTENNNTNNDINNDKNNNILIDNNENSTNNVDNNNLSSDNGNTNHNDTANDNNSSTNDEVSSIKAKTNVNTNVFFIILVLVSISTITICIRKIKKTKK